MTWTLVLVALLLAWASPAAADLQGVGSEARLLLVSHWAVASGPTVDLTTGMFAVYAREPGVGKAEALRRAQAAVRAKPETAHPFFWAPFVLVGDGGATP